MRVLGSATPILSKKGRMKKKKKGLADAFEGLGSSLAHHVGLDLREDSVFSWLSQERGVAHYRSLEMQSAVY